MVKAPLGSAVAVLENVSYIFAFEWVLYSQFKILDFLTVSCLYFTAFFSGLKLLISYYLHLSCIISLILSGDEAAMLQ